MRLLSVYYTLNSIWAVAVVAVVVGVDRFALVDPDGRLIELVEVGIGARHGDFDFELLTFLDVVGGIVRPFDADFECSVVQVEGGVQERSVVFVSAGHVVVVAVD